MNNRIRWVVIIAASIGVIITSFMLIRTYTEYKKGEEEYAELAGYVGADTKSFEGNTQDNSATVRDGDAATEQEEDKRVFKRNYNRSDFPDMEIDHAALREKNRDYIGWIYMGSADISYPVVQGDDNEYYLHNTFERKANFAGCIFIDCEDRADMTMFNTFVYGHAMKNGSMFGNLRKLRKDASLIKNDPYIYMFLEDGIYRYQVYSYYIDKKDSEMYYSPDTLKEYRQYIRNALDKSMTDCEAVPDEELNSITLVTCQGSGSQKQRFFVHGIFVDRYLYI